jgi:hypothetical protein
LCNFNVVWIVIAREGPVAMNIGKVESHGLGNWGLLQYSRDSAQFVLNPSPV